MNRRTFTRLFKTLFIALTLFWGNSASAGHNFASLYSYSDYTINVSWSNLYGANHCRCGGTTYIYGLGGTTWRSESNSANWLWGTSQGAGSSATSGSLVWNPGPGYSQNVYISVWYTGSDHYSGCTCTRAPPLCPSTGCDDRVDVSAGGNPLYAHTSDIKAPVNLTASNGAFIDHIDLAWQKGSDIPDGYLEYQIFRDGTYLGAVAGGVRSYSDYVAVGTSHFYEVKTHTNSWGGHTSYAAYATGATYSAGFAATDATLYGKCALTWQNISRWAVNDIEIKRDGVQIAIVNKNSTHYNDFDGVPGKQYTYTIAAIDANNVSLPPYTDAGASRPNGVLSGYVRSLYGTGVQNVTLTATGTVGGTTRTYSAITDASGFYKIKDIYYDTAATYTVVASKDSDQFNPPSISRLIDVLNYNNTLADIIDTTVFTVRGQVTYAGTNCPLKGAQLYVNGSYSGRTTDANGRYSFIAQQPGAYTIAFKYYNHQFDSATRTIIVSDNSNSAINFRDIQRDTLTIDLKGGCHNQICQDAQFRIKFDPFSASTSCFDSTYTFNGFNPVVLSLPAMKFRVSVASVRDPGNAPNLSIPAGLDPIDVDLTHRDSVVISAIDTQRTYVAAYNDTFANGTIIHHPADTIYMVDTSYQAITPSRFAGFVYHGPLSIELTNVDSICTGPTVEKGVRVPVGLYVRENSSFNGTVTSCLQDTGTMRIYDDVSGAGLNYYHFDHGRLLYQLVAGEPNVPDNSTLHQYQKLFNVFVSAGNKTANLDAWMTITGDKTLTATFATKTPPIPLMVLHDPPGGNSYSSWEKDSSYSIAITQRGASSQGNGGYLDIQLGKKFGTPFFSIPGAYFKTSIDGLDTKANANSNAANMTITATQTISTSSDPAFVGRDADVFVGASINTKYAFAYNLSILNGCQVKIDTVLIWGIDSVNTTFAYTGDYIKNTLIPNLEQVKAAAPDSSKSTFQNQINLWNQVLRNDSIAIARASYTQNISFSSGLSYDYTLQSDTSFENTYSYTNSSDINFAIGGGISDAELIDVGAGAQFQWHTESGNDNTTNATKTTTFSYHFEDQVPGNFYSVNVGKDKNFGSPIFQLFAGTSACPHEEGTQFRDKPTMVITPGAVFNVPANQPASLVAQLGNQSESFESRTYNVSVVPETNLDGAIIRLGGQLITQTPASFTIPSFSTINTALSVEKGPFAADYNDLALRIYSPCDDNIEKIVPFSVHFQSSCSDVALALPTDNWLANSSNHDTLFVAFSGYNASNPNLVEIGLQYRLSGSTQSWLPGPAVPVSALTDPYKTIAFNISNLPDGNYELRAYASCGATNGGNTYSPTLHGVIDRKSFTLFGTPQPSSGVLNLGDDISIQFNETIDCNQIYERMQVTLRRADNNQIIPDTFICNGDKLIITTKPASLIDSLDNVTLIATVDKVYDANGNKLNAPVEWSFLVNRSQVYWSPSNLNISATQGSPASGIGTLVNKANNARNYVITKYPSWLTPSGFGSSIPSNGQDTIRFTVQAGLNPGTYIDTIIAESNGLKERLFVKLDVTKPAPNWSVNPAAYQHSMNVIATFSTTAADAPLSADRRDKIAVFKGNECRGVGYMQYVATTNSYLAFITVYSNSSVGDTLNYRMWDAVPGTEYQAVERLAFIADGTVGQPTRPIILHPAGVFQTIYFNSGWSWFSLNVSNADMSTNKVLASLRPNNGATVKSRDKFAQYTNAASGWQGVLTQFNNKESYMIQLDHADTLHYLGQAITDTTILTLPAGWNWIGFPRQDIADAGEYLRNVPAVNGDLIKSQSSFAVYQSNVWVGGLNNFYPGQGYKLNNTNAFNFVIPPSRSLPIWSVDNNKFEQNQTVTSLLAFNGAPSQESHFIVGAFVNNGATCVGLGQPQYLADLNLYRIFLTIQGDASTANQPITFKVYDTDNNIEYQPTYDTLFVKADTAVAKVESAYVINVQFGTGINQYLNTDGFSLLQNVPNPFNNQTTIEYVMPKSQQVNISLYDEQGRLVKEIVNVTQTAGRHSVVFSQEELQAGIYFYRMRSGEYTRTRRMMIMK